MDYNSRIAKNTLFLFVRMLCVVIVSLYTVRVTLSALGIGDYGIYQTVMGITALLTFLNNALSTGSSRFLTYELGKKNVSQLNTLFSSLLLAHFIIALIIAAVSEISGIWYINHYLFFSNEKNAAAFIVLQSSVVVSIMGMTQIPYISMIIAHEQLKIYAYMSLLEVFLKLFVSFFITLFSVHRLEIFAILTCFVQIIVMLMYRIYCYRNFEVCNFRLSLCRWSVLREVTAFSCWSLFAAVSVALVNQGTILLINAFFSPLVVAARVIALQVSNISQQFVSNFRTAVNPQIVKRLSKGDVEGSKRLLLQSMCFSYYLMLLLVIPLYILAEPILSFWLTNVPDYTVPFFKLSLIQGVFSVFDTSLYTALYAKGRLKENALISPTVWFLLFPICYFLFRIGFSPIVISYMLILNYALLGLVIKPFLVHRIAQYDWYNLKKAYFKCIKVTFFLFPLNYFLSFYVNKESFLSISSVCVISFFSNISVIWFVGLKFDEREYIKKMVHSRLMPFR